MAERQVVTAMKSFKRKALNIAVLCAIAEAQGRQFVYTGPRITY